MTKGTEILSYKGNAELAKGSSLVPDYAKLTDTIKDLSISAFEQNQVYYNQRIADRDKLFKMIDDDKLVPDNILEDDRALVTKSLEAYQNIFYKYGGDITSDPNKYREFVQAGTKAKGEIANAQKKYLSINAELDALKKETDPYQKEQREKHIAKMKATSYTELPTPYVPVIDFNLEKVAATPLFGAAKQVGLNNVSTIDPEATMGLYYRNWSDPSGQKQFRNFIGKINSLPDPLKKIQEINKQLQEKSKEAGIQITGLTPVVDPATGDVHFKEPDYEVAAKIRMADEPSWSKSEFDAKRGDYKRDGERIAASIKTAQISASATRDANYLEMIRAGYVPNKSMPGGWELKYPKTGTGVTGAPTQVNYWNDVLKQEFGNAKDEKGNPIKPPAGGGDVKIGADQVAGLSIALHNEKNKDATLKGFDEDSEVRLRYNSSGEVTHVIIDGVAYNENSYNSKFTDWQNKSMSSNKTDAPLFPGQQPLPGQTLADKNKDLLQ